MDYFRKIVTLEFVNSSEPHKLTTRRHTKKILNLHLGQHIKSPNNHWLNNQFISNVYLLIKYFWHHQFSKLTKLKLTVSIPIKNSLIQNSVNTYFKHLKKLKPKGPNKNKTHRKNKTTIWFKAFYTSKHLIFAHSLRDNKLEVGYR